MAWPLTPFITFLVDSVPVIGAEFLNQIQTTANDLFEGVITLKGIVVDGIGGLADVGSPGDIIASGKVQAGTEHYTPGAHSKAHLDAARVRWTDTDANAAGANPLNNVALLNELRAINTNKAWARVLTDGFATTNVKDGANILTVTRQAPDVLRFAFAANMKDSNYSVTFSGSALDSGGGAQVHFYMLDGDQHTSFFDVHCGTFSGGPDNGTVIDPDAFRVNLMVQVFGRQDS